MADGEAIIGIGADPSQLVTAMEQVGTAAQENIAGIASAAAGEANIDTGAIAAEVMAQIQAVESMLRAAQASVSIAEVSGPDRAVLAAGLTATATQPVQQAIAGLPAELQPQLFAALQSVITAEQEAAAQQQEFNAAAAAAASASTAASGETLAAKLENAKAENRQAALSAKSGTIQQGVNTVLENMLVQYGRLSEALGYEVNNQITIGGLTARLEELNAEALVKRREANAATQVGAHILAGGELAPIEVEASAAAGQRAAQAALVKRYQTLADAVGEEADLSLSGAEMEAEANRLRLLNNARLAEERAARSAARPVELTQTEVDAQAVTALRSAEQRTVRNYTLLSEQVGEQANLQLSAVEMQSEINRITEQIKTEKAEQAAAAKLAKAQSAPTAVESETKTASAVRNEQLALEGRLAVLRTRLADAGGNPEIDKLPPPTNTSEYRERIAQVTAALGEQSTAAQQQAEMFRITAGEAAEQATIAVQQTVAETEALTLNKEWVAAKARSVIAQQEQTAAINAQIKAQGGTPRGGGPGGGGGIFGNQFGSLARGLVSGGVAFAIFGGVREAVESTLKLEESMARLRVRMTEIGQANQFPKLREDILAISRDTGIAADKVAEVAGKLSASFGSGAAGAAATRSVAQLAVVGGVDINSLQDQIQAIGRSYGKTGEQIVQVNDDITSASQRYGQSIDELAKGAAVLAQSGDFAGISVTKLVNIIGQAAQVSGTSASAIAERLTRIIPLIDTHASQLLVLARTDSTLGKVLTPETFQQGSGAVLNAIASNFGTFSQGIQEQLLQILGSGRGAQSLLPIFQQWSDIMKNVDNSTGNAGSTQRAFNAQMQTAAETLKRIRTDFNLFIASLADSGALNEIEGVLKVFEKILTVLGELNDDLDGTPGKIAVIAGSLKVVQLLVEKIAGTSLAGALLPAGARTFLGATAPAAAAAPVEAEAAAVVAPTALALSDLLLPAIAVAIMDAANRYSDKNAPGGVAGRTFGRVGLDIVSGGVAEIPRGARNIYNHFFGGGGSASDTSTDPSAGPPDDSHLKDLQKQADDLKKKIDQEQVTLDSHTVPQVAVDAITKNMESEKKRLEDLNSSIQTEKSNLTAAAATANAANTAGAAASQGQLEILQALDDVKADYEAGVVPLQTLLDRIGAEAQAEGDLANGTEGADKLSHLRKAAQLRQQANQLLSQAASSGLDLQNSLDESTAGSDAAAAQRAFDRTVALFNETTDPTAKAELAKKVVSAGNALLKATADQATSTAEAAKILTDGIKLPPGLNSSLYGEELKQSDPEFVGAIFKAAANPDIADKALKLFTDLTTQGDSYIDAIKKVRDYLAQQWTIAHDHLYHNATDADSGAPPPPTGNLFSRIAGAATPAAPAPPDAPAPPPPTFDPPKPKIHIPTSQDIRDISAGKKKQDQADQEAVTNERAMRAAQQQLRQAQAGGDAVALAQAGIDAANQELADAKADELRARKAGDANGVAKAQADAIRAQADKIRADKSMSDAIHGLMDSRLGLLETLAKVAGDDVAAAGYELQRAQGNLDKLLKDDPGNKTAIDDARGQVAQATQGVTDAILNTAVSEEQFLYDTGQVTTAQMIAFLQSQLRLPGLTKKQTEDLQRQIYQLQHTLGQDFQFDVPSDLKLPTLYEARRLEQTSAVGAGYQDNRQFSIQLYVTNGMDQAQAKQFLSDTVGTGNSVLSSNRRI